MLSLLLALAVATDPMDTIALPIPDKYTKSTDIVLHTRTQSGIDKECGAGPEGYQMLGCSFGHILYMPNPCFYPEAKDRDSYAHLLCHELAHTNGWHHVNE